MRTSLLLLFAVLNAVCASCPEGVKVTFGSDCELDCQNERYPNNQCVKLHDEQSGVCDILCEEIYSPICALCANTTETTFGNICELNRQNSCDPTNQCVRISEGECPPQECSDQRDPICATCLNGPRTFQNKCVLESYKALYPEDNCQKQYDGQCRVDCPIKYRCSETYEPICALCGIEEREFNNECFFKSFNCPAGNECKKLRDGPCETMNPRGLMCSGECTLEYNPVCAQCPSGQNTFSNLCLLEQNNCYSKPGCSFLRHGPCEPVNPGGPICPSGCTREYMPVCAQCPNGEQTFSNLCLLQQNNCQSSAGCSYLREGTCTQDACNRPCPSYNASICAVCANNKYMSFPNTCEMQKYNCRNNETCQYVSDGGSSCPPRDSIADPGFPTSPSECAAVLCSAEPEYLCARCGPTGTLQTFRNGCLLGIHNCFNNQECKKIYDGKCRETPRPIICSVNRNPICATTSSGPTTFQNECFFDSYAILNPQENSTKLYAGTCNTTCPLYKCSSVEEKQICALCGFEQQTFQNECFFNAYNCPAGNECIKIKDGPCSSLPPLICSAEYEPVCASCSYGFETFANSCFMRAENIANPDSRCVERMKGPCGATCPEERCSDEESPFCGQCGGRKLTFPNQCSYNSYNCKWGYTCIILYSGECH